MNPSSRRLQVLVVEDRSVRAQLIVRALRTSGFEIDPRTVRAEPEFIGALGARVDVVVCDPSVHDLEPLRILEILRQRGDPTPLVIVFDPIGEEAADLIAGGAVAHVPTDRIRWLGAAVERAIDHHPERERPHALDTRRCKLLGRLASIETEERRQVSEGIHDDIVGSLAALRLRLETLASAHSELREDGSLLGAIELVEHTIADLRNLLFELHPAILDSVGVEFTVRKHLEQLAESSDTPKYRFRAELEKEPPPSIRSLLYRIAHEAIANAREHARAAYVDVSLEEEDGGFLTTIADDGVGFEVYDERGSPPGRLGLTSMSERVEVGQGWLLLESAPGRGTKVRFWLPDVDLG